MTDGSVRTLRHNAKDLIASASAALVGAPGLSVDTQLERLATASDALQDAVTTIDEAIELVESREEERAASTETVSADDDALVAKITAAVLSALKG